MGQTERFVAHRGARIPARRNLLREIVEDGIREAIMDGTLVPGEVLHDDALKTWFGVSRTPIREALNELARTGLVEMSPNRYTRIARIPTGTKALEARQALGILLGSAFRLALPRVEASERETLAKELELISAELRSAEPDAARLRAYKLGDRVAERTGNSYFVNAYRGASSGLFHLVRLDPFSREQVLDAFADLACAVRNGNGESAEAAIGTISQVSK